MEILNTIFPLFIVIFVGFFASKFDLIPNAFIGPANRLTYYLAIPAMIFPALARDDIFSRFDIWLVAGTIVPLFIVFALFWLISISLKVPKEKRGSFIECAIHGNIGYIGLAVVLYYLGDKALTTAALLAGFLMLTHNVLAVVALRVNTVAQNKNKQVRQTVFAVIGNPIILTSLAGALFSLSPFALPAIVERTLHIVGNLALPMALLIIGASLRFTFRGKQLVMILMASISKLVVLPALGYLFYRQFNLPISVFLPGLVLLATPVATVAFILAKQLKGDPDLASGAISLSTVISLVTFTFWLNLVG